MPSTSARRAQRAVRDCSVPDAGRAHSQPGRARATAPGRHRLLGALRGLLRRRPASPLRSSPERRARPCSGRASPGGPQQVRGSPRPTRCSPRGLPGPVSPVSPLPPRLCKVSACHVRRRRRRPPPPPNPGRLSCLSVGSRREPRGRPAPLPPACLPARSASLPASPACSAGQRRNCEACRLPDGRGPGLVGPGGRAGRSPGLRRLPSRSRRARFGQRERRSRCQRRKGELGREQSCRERGRGST